MDWMLKKILSLLLAVTVIAGMNGVPVWAADSAGQENGSEAYTGNVAFTVTMDETTTTYPNYDKFADIWKNLQGKTAEICLLKDLNLDDITFDHDGDTDSLKTLKLESGNITLKIANGKKLYNTTDQQLIWITGGTFTLEGDESSELSVGTNGLVIGVGNASVQIQGKVKLKGNTCISADKSSDVRISQCILESGEYAVQVYNGYVNDILANGFAYQQKNEGATDQWKWIEDGDQIDHLGPGTFRVMESPVRFNQQPQSTTVTYGDTLPALQAGAEITQPEAVGTSNPNDIAYKWYQMEGDDARETNTTIPEYAFSEILDAGSYQYYCRATCRWFSLNSKTAVITVTPKPVTAKIVSTGDIIKEYDGTTDVPSGLLSVQLDGILDSDSVTPSALFYYDSPEPGIRKITAKIKLFGDDAANYELDSDTISVDGKITGTESDIPVTGVLLDRHSLSMTVGGRQQLTASILPENASNKNVSWTSDNPAAASVGSSGNITAVGAGSAVITVTTADGNRTDSCTVTVSSAGGSTGSGGSSGNIFINFNLPFVKGHPDKKGWTAIQKEAVTVPEGGTTDIDMNGSVLVPGSFFTAVKGRDITVVFDMGSGISWSVCGKDITAETASDINLSVRTGAGKIPRDVLNSTAGASAHLELSPVHNGPFGFTAVLTIQTCIGGNGIMIGTGKTDAVAGMYANLFAYDPDQRSLSFICADCVGDDGKVRLPAVGASDWTVILSAYPMDGTDVSEDPSASQNGTEPENPQEPEETAKAQVKSVKLSKTVYTYSGKAKKPAVTAVYTVGRRISDRYYTVSYQNNVKAGRAVAVIKFKGGYSGTVKKTFTIRPAGTSMKKTTALSGGFTVKWAKRTSQTSGYQIQYSRTAGFKGNSTHSAFVKKASTTAKTVKKLSAGKKYYVRIRTYKTVKTGGKNTNIYSAWSNAAVLRVK